LKRLGGVAKQSSISNASRIDRAENKACVVVEAPVHLSADDHIAQLAVFVGFAGFEWLGINHANGIQKSLLQSFKVTKIGRCRNRHLAAKFFRISRHSSQGHQPGVKLRILFLFGNLCLDQLGHQQTTQ